MGPVDISVEQADGNNSVDFSVLLAFYIYQKMELYNICKME